MANPLVFIFERHWDTVPKQLTNEMLSELFAHGYDALAMEAHPSMTTRDLIASLNGTIEQDTRLLTQAEMFLKRVGIVKKLSEESFGPLASLMRLYVSSQRFAEVAQKIKDLPACQILKRTLDQAEQAGMLIKGVDAAECLDELYSASDVSQRSLRIVQHERQRIEAMFANIMKLRKEREGVIFCCGASHAENLLNKFKEANLESEVLYYFPHTAKRYDDRLDDVNGVCCITPFNKLLNNPEGWGSGGFSRLPIQAA